MTETVEPVGEETLRLLTVKQVAVLLNCSAKTVYRKIWDGELKSVPFGARSIRIAPGDLRDYEDGLRAQARPAA
jgi:excisionase family DNA binding protein